MRCSIVIPVYNRVLLARSAIESSLAQDFEDCEIIVVDNCSTEPVWEMVNSFHDPRLKAFRNDSNIGRLNNFTRCAQLARGDYLVFLSSDDQLEPGFLSRAVPQMDRHPQAVLLSSRGRLVDLAGQRIRDIATLFPPGLYPGTMIVAPTFWALFFCGENPFNYPSGVVFRRAELVRELPFDNSLGGPADVDMFLRCLRYGDLIVTSVLGCRIVLHPGQDGAELRLSGQLARDRLKLLEHYRPELEHAGIYQRLVRQSAADAFDWLFFRWCAGERDLAAARKFGQSWPRMLSAKAVRTTLGRLHRTTGLRFTRFLHDSRPLEVD